MIRTCYLCGSARLEEFPAILDGKSLTTDGRLVPLQAHNAQCLVCGLMQKLQSHESIFEHLSYAKDYELYARPDMKQFDAGHHQAYAQWVARYFPSSPQKLDVLEVGCGAGWMLEKLQTMYPNHHFEGIEPSFSAVDQTPPGIKVTAGTVEKNAKELSLHAYDVVFSINVIEHTPDPVAFIHSLAQVTKPGGIIITICPNSDMLSIESLFIDHLYGFRQSNLESVYRKSGVKPLTWSAGPTRMEELHLLVGIPTKGLASHPEAYNCPTELLEKRRRYMQAWARLDTVLLERMAGHENIVCFGAGEMSEVVSTFAPDAWQKVKAYAIDGTPDGTSKTHRGLPVYYLGELSGNETLILGTRPHYQDKLNARLGPLFPTVITWNDLVKY